MLFVFLLPLMLVNIKIIKFGTKLHVRRVRNRH